MPNYGELWALFFNDINQLNKVFTPKVIEQSTSSDELFIDNAIDSPFYSYYFLTYGNGRIRVATIIGYDKDSNKAAILTMFPFQTSGKKYDVKITEVHPTEEHTEAFVQGTISGNFSLIGFEPTYLVTSKKIKIGENLPFLFSAFGYTLFKSENYFMSLDNMELEDTLKRLKIEDSLLKRVMETEPDGVQFDLSKLNAFVPMIQGSNDYYFLGRITSLSSFSFEHILFYNFEISINIDTLVLEIPLVIPFDRIEPEFKPAVGDSVIGSFWLQTLLDIKDDSKE